MFCFDVRSVIFSLIIQSCRLLSEHSAILNDPRFVERSNTVCPTRYRTRLAGGPLLRVAKIRRTTDTQYKHIPFHF